MNLNIGNILLAWGVINKPQLDAAVAAQATSEPPKKLGELVVGMGYATPEQIQTCLDKQEQLRCGDLPLGDIATVAEYATASVRRTSEELAQLSADIVRRDKKRWGEE